MSKCSSLENTPSNIDWCTIGAINTYIKVPNTLIPGNDPKPYSTGDSGNNSEYFPAYTSKLYPPCIPFCYKSPSCIGVHEVQNGSTGIYRCEYLLNNSAIANGWLGNYPNNVPSSVFRFDTRFNTWLKNTSFPMVNSAVNI